jgi:hypothetical protein
MHIQLFLVETLWNNNSILHVLEIIERSDSMCIQLYPTETLWSTKIINRHCQWDVQCMKDIDYHFCLREGECVCKVQRPYKNLSRLPSYQAYCGHILSFKFIDRKIGPDSHHTKHIVAIYYLLNPSIEKSVPTPIIPSILWPHTIF